MNQLKSQTNSCILNSASDWTFWDEGHNEDQHGYYLGEDKLYVTFFGANAQKIVHESSTKCTFSGEDSDPFLTDGTPVKVYIE